MRKLQARILKGNIYKSDAGVSLQNIFSLEFARFKFGSLVQKKKKEFGSGYDPRQPKNKGFFLFFILKELKNDIMLSFL